MLENIHSENVLFLDIETVSQNKFYDELAEPFKNLWDRKAQLLAKTELDTPSSLYERAAIYAEFGKIICISVGFLREDKIRVKSFAGDDEFIILNEFAHLINKSYNKSESLLCAHNGKEFDFPYISRRMLINGIPLPSILNVAGCKPWEVKHIDTMELWRFGDHKNFTSLELLTSVFGIETPKGDISGDQVGNVYWTENNLERIVNYCQKDVIAVVQLFRKYRGEPLISSNNIIIVP